MVEIETKKNYLNLYLFQSTLPIAKIISDKKCAGMGLNTSSSLNGFIFKKINEIKILKWKRYMEPFRISLLNSTANSANFHQNWAGLAVLFSRQILSGSQDFFFFLIVFFFSSLKPLLPMPAHFWHLSFQL